MYVLENDVAWTDDLKNAFKHGTTKAKILYLNDSEVESEINENNNLISIELKDFKYVPEQGFIGQAISKMVTIEIQNTERTNKS